MTEEDEKAWKALAATVAPLGCPKGKRIPVRYKVKSEPRCLDLHGFTVQQAYETCKMFIEDTRYKSVIIITGRSGQIRIEFERWLSTFSRVKRWTMMNEGSFEIELYQ